MKCPRCHSSLKAAHYEGVETDMCHQCSGIWLDAGELGRIANTTSEKFSKGLISLTLHSRTAGIPKAEQDSVEKCPKCTAPMRANNYSYGSGVIIDSCPQGHGIWLDEGEIEKIQAFKEFGDQQLRINRGKWGGIARQAGAQAAKMHGEDFASRLARLAKDWLKLS